MSKNESQAYRLLAIEFAGQDRAKQVADLINKYQKSAGIKVKAWAVVEVDEKGKAHVKQSGHGGVGAATGVGVGALLGLIGGPAGLLIWTLGGALVVHPKLGQVVAHRRVPIEQALVHQCAHDECGERLG